MPLSAKLAELAPGLLGFALAGAGYIFYRIELRKLRRREAARRAAAAE